MLNFIAIRSALKCNEVEKFYVLKSVELEVRASRVVRIWKILWVVLYLQYMQYCKLMLVRSVSISVKLSAVS